MCLCLFQTEYILPDDDGSDGESRGSRSRASGAARGGGGGSGGGAIPDFPPATGKEYILRAACCPRPAPWSLPSPQRMYAVVIRDDFRLAGAFTSDTTFQ